MSAACKPQTAQLVQLLTDHVFSFIVQDAARFIWNRNCSRRLVPAPHLVPLISHPSRVPLRGAHCA
jgi:hypothetical protein